MTAPLRQNGQLVTTTTKGCTNKNRCSDEHAARAYGIERQLESGFRMYIYKCPRCKGYHITRQRQRNHMLAADFYLNQSVKEAA